MHDDPFFLREIVVSNQMEQTMDRTEGDFVIHVMMEFFCICCGNGNSDQYLAMLEGDHIGRLRIIEKFPMDFGNRLLTQ